MSELFTELPLGKFFESMVEKQPDHEFIVYPDRNLRFTYKEFDERVDNLAKGMLENAGIQAAVLHQDAPYAGISFKLSIDLAVNDEDYDRAVELLKEAEEGEMTLDEKDAE